MAGLTAWPIVVGVRAVAFRLSRPPNDESDDVQA
ncbi:hypothetical protein PLANPX_3303 [Lacipirellula parvula]|uniref:Uncharacterized protein n=1 Tax=Lacipirellula parvula TaxID=2650471 RepID=A0A5K7XFN9_9BACT|nr:hypothetical protein PLANPX_3303 [Lacipirellula parvula]